MTSTSRANGKRLDHVSLANQLGMWSNNSGPLYKQLSTAVAQLIETGVLKDGEILPPERTLAAELSVSRGTIVNAYDRLRDANLVARVQGSGTTVRYDPRIVDPSFGDAVGRPLFTPRRATIDLMMAMPDLLPFAFDIMKEVNLWDNTEVLQTIEPAGIPELRHVLAERMTADGLPTTASQIAVTAGAQQGISVLTMLLARPGDVVLCEEATWPGLSDTARMVGARVIGVPMDDYGMIVEEFELALKRFRPALVGINPHHQNPTGSCLPPARRQAIAELAAAYEVPLIEDRVSARLNFSGSTPPPLASHTTDGIHITVDSINKVAWAGLRMGWIRAESNIIREVRPQRGLLDIYSPPHAQLMTIPIIERLDEVVAQRVGQLQPRAQLVEEAVAEYLPGWELAPVSGGLVHWARLPYGSAAAFAEFAARFGVSVASGSAFASNTTFENRIRLPFTQNPEILSEAMHRLGQAWAAFDASEDPLHVSPIRLL